MLQIDLALAARTCTSFVGAIREWPPRFQLEALEKRRTIVWLRQCANAKWQDHEESDAAMLENRADDLERDLEKYLTRRCPRFDARAEAHQ